MKRIYLVAILLLMGVVTALADVDVTIGKYDADDRMALLTYTLGADGLYHKEDSKPVKVVRGDAYAYDASTNILYIRDEHSNYTVRPNKNLAKEWKNNPSVEHDKAKIQQLVYQVNKELVDSHAEFNSQVTAERQAEAEKAREAERAARQARVAEQEKREAPFVPIGGRTLKCLICPYEEKGVEKLEVFAVAGDRLYQNKFISLPLGTHVVGTHVYDIPADLKTYPPFAEHIRKYGKYLSGDGRNLSLQSLEAQNRQEVQNQRTALRAAAPYGFFTFLELACSDSDGSLAMRAGYNNCSERTITKLTLRLSYPDQYDDIVEAEFTLNGPLQTGEEGEWEFPQSEFPCPDSIDGLSATLTVRCSDGSMVTLDADEIVVDAPKSNN